MILLSYLIKVNVAFAVLFLVYYLFLRKEKFLVANRVVLFTILISSFILPLAPTVYHQDLTGYSAPAAPDNVLPASFNFSEIKPAAGPVATSITLQQPAGWLTRVYIITILFLFTRFLIRLYRVCSILKTSRQSKENGIVYCEPATDTPPFSFFNFIVVSPGIGKEEYKQIIVHERAHCLQRHSFDLLLADLAVILLWVNPLAYICRREVRLNLEYLADEAAIIQGIDPKSYQLTLLACSGNFSFNFPAIPFSSRLKSRIGMMNTAKPHILNGYKYLALLPVLFLISVLTGFKDTGSVLTREIANSAIPERRSSSMAIPSDEKVKTKPAVRSGKKRQVIPIKDAETALRSIHVNATTDTVKFRFIDRSINEPIAVKDPFDGIYVIGDKIIAAADIRKEMEKAKTELTYILSSRPVLTVYSAGDEEAINKWGAQAKNGVISIQSPVRVK